MDGKRINQFRTSFYKNHLTYFDVLNLFPENCSRVTGYGTPVNLPRRVKLEVIVTIILKQNDALFNHRRTILTYNTR